MVDTRAMIPIEALQFPQAYEANPRLKRTYHVKRERTRNKDKDRCDSYKRSSSDYNICEDNHSDQTNKENEAEGLMNSSAMTETNIRTRSRSIDSDYPKEEEEEEAEKASSCENIHQVAHGHQRMAMIDEKSRDDQSIVQRVDWWEDFDLLLHHPVGIRLFTEFLTKEFSEENIVFWKACQEYKSITDKSLKIRKAEQIFSQHLASDAPEPVNIDSGARQAASEAVKSGTSVNGGSPELFNNSQKQIYNLMKMDSFQRFLQSSIFKEYIDAEKERSQNENDSKQGKGGKQDNKKWSLPAWTNIIGGIAKVKEKDHELPGLSSRTFSSPDIALLSQTCPDIQFARILLPDGSTAILSPQPDQTLRDMIQTLLRRRGETRGFKAFLDSGSHIDLELSSCNVGNSTVVLQWTV